MEELFRCISLCVWIGVVDRPARFWLMNLQSNNLVNNNNLCAVFECFRQTLATVSDFFVFVLCRGFQSLIINFSLYCTFNASMNFGELRPVFF